MTSIGHDLVALAKFVANFVKGTLFMILYILKAIVLFFVPKCFLFKDVTKDIVLITGGASGIGRLMAIEFAKKGAKVVVWDVNLAGLEETAKMIEELRSKRDKIGTCVYYHVDISDRHTVYAAAERVKADVGDVSIIVNNAGIVTGRRFLDTSDDKILKTFDVNVLAHFWIIKAFLPAMMSNNRGHIVSIASIAGLIGAYQLVDYCASKFGAVGLDEALSLELRCDGYDGIHTTLVCPYYINTGMFAGVGRSLIPRLEPKYVARETVKAVLVNQEVLYLPSILYSLLLFKAILPVQSFIWAHRAIGATNTMKHFTGRQQAGQHNGANAPQTVLAAHMAGVNGKLMPTTGDSVAIKMTPNDIGITIPPSEVRPSLQLQQ